MSQNYTPNFSAANPFWQPLFFKCNAQDYLYATGWEMRRPSPLWAASDGGWKIALRIAFTQGGTWKMLWKMQLKNQLKWTWRKLLKEQHAREAELRQAASLGSELSTPVEVA